MFRFDGWSYVLASKLGFVKKERRRTVESCSESSA